jgi:hypothetical protein
VWQGGAGGTEERHFLAITIYNFVLGASFITAAVLFMIGHRRAPYLAGVTAFLYIVCTVVNEMVQLAHGVDLFERHARLAPRYAVWDILFWSFFPALALVFSILTIRMERRASLGRSEASS